MKDRATAHRSWKVSALAPLIVLACACGPIQLLPGGPLRGEVVSGPVADWSFSDAYTLVELETRPAWPHSVTVICVAASGNLYVPSINPQGKRWVRFVTEDPRTRLRIGDKVYLTRALRVTDEAEIEAVRAAFLAKYKPESPPPRDANIWLFRMEPRT